MKENINMQNKSLNKIKVLDLSRYIAGPFCGQILGDLGADVVKVERADGGEEGRRVGEMVDGETLFFMGANRNKRSLTLDFRNPDGQALLRRLAAEADILIENFRPGTLEKMGCGYDVLSAKNPGLILVRISGFGQDGPMASHPCFDGAAQAHSGIMTLTGQADGAPTMAGVFASDYSTALYASIAALAALQARQETGRGQVVEATLMDSALSMLTTAIGESKLFGIEQSRLGNRDRYLSPSHCFKSRDDKWVYVVAGNDHHFVRFCEAMGKPELQDDERFATFFARNANVAELEAIIDAWGLEHDAEAILQALHDVGVPASRLPASPMSWKILTSPIAGRLSTCPIQPVERFPCRPPRSRCPPPLPASIAARRRLARIRARCCRTGSGSGMPNWRRLRKRDVYDPRPFGVDCPRPAYCRAPVRRRHH